ncbi:protein STPG4 [Rhinoderma darwinii]|uniref:protein STPG4 n=1 Tax=Rhinoderma darwinii TaxID=43563 RepID=UPI003F6611B5
MTAVKIRRSNQQITRHKKNPDIEQEKLFTERDAWWLYSLRESPRPGTYNVRDFLDDAKRNPVQQTYSFKGQGRKKPLSTAGSGEALLPGCYKIPEFRDLVEKLPRLSSFRNISRSAVLLGVRDKDIDTDPCQYNLITPHVDHQQCKHFMFRSAVQRFPTTYFIPREGPGPGEYNVKNTASPSISSSFKSSVPRFRSSYSKTPGPGTYDPTRQLPKQPPTVARMGRMHGLFFRNSFDF